MLEDELNQQFRRSVQEGRENLAQLVKRIEEWHNRVLLPPRGKKECEMERVAKLRSRAEERLSHGGDHPHLDVRVRARRVNAVYLARQSRYDKLWIEFGHLTDEVRATLQGLRPVLGPDEVERLTQEVKPNMLSIDSMLGAVKRAADRIEEFFQACPEAEAETARVVQQDAPTSDRPLAKSPAEVAGLATATSIEVALPPAGPAVLKEPPADSREDRLSRFMLEHLGTTYADIKYSARVHTPEFQDWRKGKLKPDSVMSERIEQVLAGATPLTKKRPKPRPE